jgi:hypothetical protein
MIHDFAHAAHLQDRFERLHGRPEPRVTADFRTLAALAGLLKHFTGDDEALSDELWEAARDCVGEDTRSDGGCSVCDLLNEWDYSTTPQAAVTYLQARLAPSLPVNRVRA